MSKKDLKIENLSKYRYRELKNICFQYGEMKEKLKNMSYIKAAAITGVSSSHNIADVTADFVIRRDKLKQRIGAIEQAALEADSLYYQDILYSVTNDIPFEYINTRLCRTDFYKRKRLFFTILDRKI